MGGERGVSEDEEQEEEEEEQEDEDEEEEERDEEQEEEEEEEEEENDDEEEDDDEEEEDDGVGVRERGYVTPPGSERMAAWLGDGSSGCSSDSVSCRPLFEVPCFCGLWCGTVCYRANRFGC